MLRRTRGSPAQQLLGTSKRCRSAGTHEPTLETVQGQSFICVNELRQFCVDSLVTTVHAQTWRLPWPPLAIFRTINL